MKMRKSDLILWIVVAFLLLVNSESFSWNYVCIDPGHGGSQSGTVGRVYGVLEKEVNLGVGAWAYTYFGIYGWDPIMTRYVDIKIDQPHRVNIDNNACKILENK
jgi:N-acetylmuramoyl-L-alanine amidase